MAKETGEGRGGIKAGKMLREALDFFFLGHFFLLFASYLKKVFHYDCIMI